MEHKKTSSVQPYIIAWLVVLTVALIIAFVLVEKSLVASEFKTAIMRIGNGGGH